MWIGWNLIAPALLDTLQPVEKLVFELYLRNIVCIAMATFRVVEHLDVVEDVATGLLPIEIGLTADTLPL